MNVQVRTITPQAEELLEKLAEELRIRSVGTSRRKPATSRWASGSIARTPPSAV